MDLLDFLGTSRARKSLLHTLLGKGLSGSVSELARQSGVQPGAAQKELERMEALGLVVSKRVRAGRVVHPNLRFRPAREIRRLLDVKVGPAATDAADQKVRAALASYGAPLHVPKDVPVDPLPPLETALADGLRLAHKDPAVGGNLPVVIWHHRNHLNLPELVRSAVRRGEAQTLGFMLELTDQLAGEPFFAAAARGLFDKRVRRMRNFFSPDGSFDRFERDLAVLNSPEVAERWHYLMNMSLDSFASYFRKGSGRGLRLRPA